MHFKYADWNSKKEIKCIFMCVPLFSMHCAITVHGYCTNCMLIMVKLRWERNLDQFTNSYFVNSMQTNFRKVVLSEIRTVVE